MRQESVFRLSHYRKAPCHEKRPYLSPFPLRPDGPVSACLHGMRLKALRQSSPRNIGSLSVPHGVNVVRTATTQLGKPYRLGGASPRSGFDCSGLIYWSFGQNGITVPRVTSSQAKVGTKVAINRLQPGDIVVFRTKNAPNGLHTGIYVGSGRFIHSPNSRSRVRVDDLLPPVTGENAICHGTAAALTLPCGGVFIPPAPEKIFRTWGRSVPSQEDYSCPTSRISLCLTWEFPGSGISREGRGDACRHENSCPS